VYQFFVPLRWLSFRCFLSELERCSKPGGIFITTRLFEKKVLSGLINPTQHGLNSGMGLLLDMGAGPPIKGKGLNSG